MEDTEVITHGTDAETGRSRLSAPRHSTRCSPHADVLLQRRLPLLPDFVVASPRRSGRCNLGLLPHALHGLSRRAIGGFQL